MNALERLVKRLAAAASVGAALCGVGMVVALATDVAVRTWQRGSVTGVTETVEMLLVIMVFLALAEAERTGSQIKVSIVTDRLPVRVASMVRAFGTAASCLVISWFVWATWRPLVVSIATAEYRGSIVRFPLWPGRLIVWIGFLVLLAVTLLKLFRPLWLVTGAVAEPEEAGDAPYLGV